LHNYNHSLNISLGSRSEHWISGAFQPLLIVY